MATISELHNELLEEKQESANRQKRIKTRINQELKAVAEEDEKNILDNYNMGMLTLHEMLDQRIDVLSNLRNATYTFEETT